MNIAIFSRFRPSVGGIETLAEIFAMQWAARGHRITITTDVPAEEGETPALPFDVTHNSSLVELLQVVRDCDLVVQHNISLKVTWPLLLVRKPLVAVHHSTYCSELRRRPAREAAKVWIARHRARNISVSQFVKTRVGCDGAVVPNPYNHAVFRNLNQARDKDLVFVGRLVSDKGVNVLLDALAELKQNGVTPSLTIVGDGPERANLENQIVQHGLERQVLLLGVQSQEEVARTLNQHRILVVPSLWEEPFGIVALEGAACGCVVVGSSGGGLPEAIGPCGVTFPNGDHRRLAAVLADLLSDPSKLEPYRAAAPEHLAKHRADVVAQKYLEFFQDVLAERKSRFCRSRAAC